MKNKKLKGTPDLYVGTAGWSYKDWVPNFYPCGQSNDFSWLQFYARYFNTVEVNSTYYTYIAPRVIDSWFRQIDDEQEFIFTVKLHQDFTHKRQYGEQQLKAVRFNLDKLKAAERFGGLLLQFPYSFECNDANVQFLRKLINEFEVYEKFVEVRHNSWQNKKAQTVTFCTIDQPMIGQSFEFNPIVGNETAYIRLHGRNVDAWKESVQNFGKPLNYEQRSARYEYLYSPGELHEIDQKLKEIYDKVKKVFVITNNHPHGDAVANAFELIHLLKDRPKIKMPQTILNGYSRLKEFS